MKTRLLPVAFLVSFLLPVALLHAASDVSVSTALTSGGSFSGGSPNVFTPTANSAVANNGTPAWSLWLNGDPREVAVRKNFVQFLTSTTYYDRKQSGQMLVVPTYLGTAEAGTQVLTNTSTRAGREMLSMRSAVVRLI